MADELKKISESKKIAESIVSYYPTLKERERINETLKESIEEKFTAKMEEEGKQDEDLVFDGYLIRRKRHTNWSWKSEFKEELEDLGILHLGVSIGPDQASLYDISDFRLPSDQYVRIFPPKAKLDEKEKREQEKQDLQNALKKKTFEELFLIFTENKSAMDEMAALYDKDREKLLKAMKDENLSDIYVPFKEDSTAHFIRMDSKAEYDTQKIYGAKVTRQYAFAYGLTDGKVVCLDLHAKTEIPFEDNRGVCDGHQLSYSPESGVLSLDGQALTPPDWDDFDVIKKKEKTELLKRNFNIVRGALEVDGSSFLKGCGVSSTKVQHLIDKGYLTSKVYDKYRFIASENDISVRFEIVNEETNNDRKLMFYNKRQREGERYRDALEAASDI